MNADLLKVHSEKIREKILVMITEAQSGHPGGSLSIADILTVLYFEQMNVNINDLRNPDRDRFVLAKGHAAPALYATLMEKGVIAEEWLGKLRQINSILQGHPDMKAIPGIDMSTGSLGQGLSAANGMALAGKVMSKEYRVYTILGDGECQEGQVWEAAMAAAHYKLDNLTAFLDFNGLQIDGKNSEVMNINPIDEKFKAFGWNVICIDGHDFEQINNAIEEAKTVKGKPTMIIAKTHKGKGVSFMEDNAGWHGVAPTKEQLNAALKEIKGGN